MILDKGTACQVINLKTSCSRNGYGCEWKSKLQHFRDKCGWTVVQSYECGVRVPRHQLAGHEKMCVHSNQ